MFTGGTVEMDDGGEATLAPAVTKPGVMKAGGDGRPRGEEARSA